MINSLALYRISRVYWCTVSSKSRLGLLRRTFFITLLNEFTCRLTYFLWVISIFCKCAVIFCFVSCVRIWANTPLHLKTIHGIFLGMDLWRLCWWNYHSFTFCTSCIRFLDSYCNWHLFLRRKRWGYNSRWLLIGVVRISWVETHEILTTHILIVSVSWVWMFFS